MISTIELKLVRPAKSSGGDRYESTEIFPGETRPLTVYIPQAFSRKVDTQAPAGTITMTLQSYDDS